MSEFLYGRQAVCESLKARRRHIHRLMLAEQLELKQDRSSGILGEIVSLAKELDIPILAIPRTKLDNEFSHHQGVVLEVGRYPYVTVDQILARAQKLAEKPFLLALDHLEDPHNLGALLRTAEIAGVHGVLIPEKRAVEITPAVVSVSAGAAEHIWVAQITNLNRSLHDLKKEGLWIVGVETAPQAQSFEQVELDMPLVLVIGAEGEGLSRLTLETCDITMRLPMKGRISSLNASVAGGLAIYEVWRKRGFNAATN